MSQSKQHSSQLKRAWTATRSALRGDQRDYTKGSIPKAVFYLAVPMVLEMLMQSALEVVDIFFVSRLGPDAVAAVGLTSSIIVIVFALCIGLSMAGTAMVARRIGEGKSEEAAQTSIQLILISIAFSLPIAVIGAYFAPQLLTLMGAEEMVVAVGTGYCRVLFAGNTTIFLLFTINAIFRGAGDASLAMRSLWIANGLNMILDPILIFGIGSFDGMGATGAAVATTIGRGVGVAFQLKILFGLSSQLKLNGLSWKPDFTKIRQIIKIGGPGMIQFLVSTASWIGIIRIIAVFGSAALAGYTIAVRVIIFVLLPSWGIGNAAATLVGQNLGAGKADRAEKSVMLTSWINSILLGCLGVILWIFTKPIVNIFIQDPEVVKYAVDCLKICAYSFPFWAIGMITVQAFNGAGDTKTPTWINLVVFWIIQIPLAYYLAIIAGYGVNAVFVSISISQALLAIFGFVIFRRGKWKTQEV